MVIGSGSSKSSLRWEALQNFRVAFLTFGRNVLGVYSVSRRGCAARLEV
jgi:hypothetical protein